MANKTKQAERDRRAKIEAMRKAEQAKERRKSMLFIIVAAVVGLGLVAAAAIPAYLDSQNDPANKDLASFGVARAAANCGSVINDPVTGSGTHVGPGTNQPNKTHVDYAEVPPTSGEHFAQPAFPASPFYTAADRPRMEQLVHNLEHGYTILWYDNTVTDKQRDELSDLAESGRETDAVGPGKKFIVSEWDDTYGAFPEGKHFALSHWGAKQGHRQLCGKLSGEVVASFLDKFPATDAPEPNAA